MDRSSGWWTAVLFVLPLSFGCSRPSVASLIPALELGIIGQRRRLSATGAELAADRRWEAVAFFGLRFRAFQAAAELPVRGELAPETWIAACDSDDVICLQEAADAEEEVAAALGELQ